QMRMIRGHGAIARNQEEVTWLVATTKIAQSSGSMCHVCKWQQFLQVNGSAPLATQPKECKKQRNHAYFNTA
ncbi:MAG: hypothetical protein MPL62_14430, partial [Alphaproteobacteria bacterium]|nr:hypothetical protein [Alphaproteobacteria bacterium]